MRHVFTKDAGHDLMGEGPEAALSQWSWWCECGKWGPFATPSKRVDGKPRLTATHMAHGKHVKATHTGDRP